MFIQHTCPGCGSANVVKNGHTYSGKARNKCKTGGRQFVIHRCYPVLSAEQKRRIELLLLERISLEGICRVMEITPNQLTTYRDELYAEIPDALYAEVSTHADIDLQCLECESDELWSFVGYKANK